MNEDQTVFIVDDEKPVRDSIKFLMESIGLQAKVFSSAQEYLDQFDTDAPGCLITDIRMPMMSGLDLQQKLSENVLHPPIIMITGHGDVPMAVSAIQQGAVDFVEKPFNNQKLLDIVYKALEIDAKCRGENIKLGDIQQKYQYLTDKERRVFELIIKGILNKQIAQELFVTQSAIEARRAKIMEKMQANNLSDLMRMGMAMGMIEV
ncbi:Nitrogen regulation protein NR(I) [hydrothermal vent metagenome]|uniref:Nitrogen regulation protein NR(I) n=1 Tax=hydrothermal vent metagenome TaxID=652676 RepID=A0A1W1D9U8_9ZZZZ